MSRIMKYYCIEKKIRFWSTYKSTFLSNDKSWIIFVYYQAVILHNGPKKFFSIIPGQKNNKKKCPNEMNPRICLEYYFLQYSESINPFFLSEIDFYVFDFTSFFLLFWFLFEIFCPNVCIWNFERVFPDLIFLTWLS